MDCISEAERRTSFPTCFRNIPVECDSFEDAAAVNVAEAVLANPRAYRLAPSSLDQLAFVLLRYDLEGAAEQMFSLSRERWAKRTIIDGIASIAARLTDPRPRQNDGMPPEAYA